MKKLVYAAVTAGVVFGISVALHEILISVANGQSEWSTRAAATCATCHGG